MRRTIRRTAFSILGLLLLLGATALYLDLHLFLRPSPPDLDTAIREQLDAAKLPGAAVAVIQDDHVAFAKGYGFAELDEKRPVTPDTVFQIASVSKLVTATVLMRLFEQGSFRLDEDINHHLPFAVRNPNHPGTAITFRMLLAHTSSIADGPSYDKTYTIGQCEDSPLALGEYLQEYFTPGGRYCDPAGNFTAHRPGTRYEYSNIGFGLAGYLVERISGCPFDKVCRKEVFTPLGMTSSHWFHAGLDKSRWAVPYRYQVLRRSYRAVGAYSFATYPDGALKTSVNDFARFLIPFIHSGRSARGKPFLRSETIAEMLRVQYPDSGSNHGIAWDIHPANAQHTGSDPGISALAVISPAKRRGLIVFTNGGGTDTLGGLRSTFGFQQFIKTVSTLLKGEAAGLRLPGNRQKQSVNPFEEVKD